MSRTISVRVPDFRQPKRRPAWMVRLGRRLHPEVVTDGWYASDCDPNYKPDSLRVRIQWELAILLRGARK